MILYLNDFEIVIFTIAFHEFRMQSFAEKVITFFSNLEFQGKLPEGVSIMNPFLNNEKILPIISEFYRKYYSDSDRRYMILGINPGRFGAGTTGIPLTDTIRLKEKLGLLIPDIKKTYEPSSVFIYEMIEQYGGPKKFYGDFYISAVSPLGFTTSGPRGNEVNYNYYDNSDLTEAILDFIVDSITKQLEFGIKREICFCLGAGKNFKFLLKLNDRYAFFNKIEPLEHPRFIMQYRSPRKKLYIEQYLSKLKMISDFEHN